MTVGRYILLLPKRNRVKRVKPQGVTPIALVMFRTTLCVTPEHQKQEVLEKGVVVAWGPYRDYRPHRPPLAAASE